MACQVRVIGDDGIRRAAQKKYAAFPYYNYLIVSKKIGILKSFYGIKEKTVDIL